MELLLGSDGLSLLTNDDLQKILDAAIQLLEVGGAQVEHEKMLDHFRQAGAHVDYLEQRVRFPRKMLEAYLEKVRITAPANRQVAFSAVAEFYEGPFLDPADGTLKEWNRERLWHTVKVARTLEHLDGVYMLCCPLKDTPVQQQPLYEKFICWSYGIRGGNAIWDTALCPKIYDMVDIYADFLG